MKRSKLDQAREANELARLELQTDIMRRRRQVLSKYDATETNRRRRQPTVEHQDEGGIYSMSKRLLGCNLGRDLERNYSPARAMMQQLKINVVGGLGKLQMNDGTNAADEAAAWFNEVWAKDCDYREPLDWSTMLQNILTSEHRDGDVLISVDDGIYENTGKLLTWESDQVLPVAATLFGAGQYKTGIQDNGIIRNQFGRIIAFSATGKRGRTEIDSQDDLLYLAAENARLVRQPWRLNQGRGVPALLTAATNLIDLYEMLASELQSAKRTAKQYAYVKRENAVTDWDTPANSPEFLPENDGRSSTDVATDGANQTTHTARNYESLETFTGGLTDYLASGDSVDFPKLDHPNLAFAPFLETVHGYSGAALGLAAVYTTLKASTSYTAFRGEMILSWQTFYWLQKHLERQVADWVAVKVLNWARKRGKTPELGKGWERRISWTWPTMPEVNEVDAQNAIALALKNGTTDYAALLGPDWRRRLEQLSEMVELIRAKNLPLKILETAAGAPAQDRDEEKAGGDGDGEKDKQKSQQDEGSRT